jgi:hypothetical protein
MIHVNVDCSDDDRSLGFHRRLGFEMLWEVPETNTPEVAAAVGMPPYRVRGALLTLAGADGTVLKLVEVEDATRTRRRIS